MIFTCREEIGQFEKVSRFSYHGVLLPSQAVVYILIEMQGSTPNLNQFQLERQGCLQIVASIPWLADCYYLTVRIAQMIGARSIHSEENLLGLCAEQAVHVFQTNGGKIVFTLIDYVSLNCRASFRL